MSDVMTLKLVDGTLQTLPRAEALAILADGNSGAKKAVKPIRLKERWGVFNGGEHIGLPLEEAEELIKRGLAVSEDPDDIAAAADGSDAQGGTGAGAGESDTAGRVPGETWQQAVKTVEATTDLEQLGRWLDTEDRASVKAAVEKQLEKLTAGDGDDGADGADGTEGDGSDAS
jgi:hypothetical protein